MFNPLIRFTILTTIWHKYKENIKSTIATILALIFIQLVYLDVTEYLQVAEQVNLLVYALAGKWLLVLAVLLVWLWGLKPKRKKSMNDTLPINKKIKTEREAKPENDPFANIRSKKRLRSRGDVLIESHNKK
ncbi:hypothetical protein [Catenovulum sediminis]|uniref:Uncharacterized protein n=1 Tax=Catenovulum sediminis TaxID=1740262 RepID=A0ABV1RC25_9ALTE|nr:hypothetical protein [Catenovulum sediminis]